MSAWPFPAIPDRRLARLSDPLTSHEAAQASREFAGAHAAKIHAALIAHGPMGKSAIARATGIDGVAVARRLPELLRDGLAEPTGHKVASDTGHSEREWRALGAAD